MSDQPRWFIASHRKKQATQPIFQIYSNEEQQIFEERCLKIDYLEGMYKLSRPNARQKSIYTENDQLGYTRTLETDYEEQQGDIHQFFENTKTLKQKIYQKLAKNKKRNGKENIQQTTFRPDLKRLKTEQNEAFNANKNKDTNRSQNSSRKWRMKTQIGDSWLMYNQQKVKPEMKTMNFHERQQKTLSNRQKLTHRLNQQKKIKQVEECTFKPKLTKYKPMRR